MDSHRARSYAKTIFDRAIDSRQIIKIYFVLGAAPARRFIKCKIIVISYRGWHLYPSDIARLKAPFGVLEEVFDRERRRENVGCHVTRTRTHSCTYADNHSAEDNIPNAINSATICFPVLQLDFAPRRFHLFSSDSESEVRCQNVTYVDPICLSSDGYNSDRVLSVCPSPSRPFSRSRLCS